MQPSSLISLVCILLPILIIGTESKSHQRIIGGSETLPHEFPYMVAVSFFGNIFCAGTLINEEWIMTAAQCSTWGVQEYTITAGLHYRYNQTGTEQYRGIDRIIRHPRYQSPGTVEHEADVALMHVREPFELNEFVQPATLAESGFPVSTYATVAGWGADHENFTEALHKVTVPFVPDATCAQAYGNETLVPSMVCYGEEGKDACVGDSGAPLMCNGTVCGIVSWGYRCGIQGYPSVYSEMSYFSNWVHSQTNHREEDPIPVTTVLTCGGKINATSARIHINSPLGESTRCSWMSNIPLSNVRFVLRSFLQPGSAVYITDLGDTGHPMGTRTVVLPNQNHTITGPRFIISMTLTPDAAESVSLEMFGSGHTPYDLWDAAVSLSGGSGSYSHPEFDDLYKNREVSHFLVSPQTLRETTLAFTRMSMEEHVACAYDSLNLYIWNETNYDFHNRYCGLDIPDPVSIPLGDLLFVFLTDHTVVGEGFRFVWS